MHGAVETRDRGCKLEKVVVTLTDMRIGHFGPYMMKRQPEVEVGKLRPGAKYSPYLLLYSSKLRIIFTLLMK